MALAARHGCPDGRGRAGPVGGGIQRTRRRPGPRAVRSACPGSSIRRTARSRSRSKAWRRSREDRTVRQPRGARRDDPVPGQRRRADVRWSGRQPLPARPDARRQSSSSARSTTTGASIRLRMGAFRRQAPAAAVIKRRRRPPARARPWVVETTGVCARQHDLAAAGSAAAATTRSVIERFTRTGRDELTYEFTVTDPVLYTRPWRGEMALKPAPGAMYEFACHEGNYSPPPASSPAPGSRNGRPRRRRRGSSSRRKDSSAEDTERARKKRRRRATMKTRKTRKAVRLVRAQARICPDSGGRAADGPRPPPLKGFRVFRVFRGQILFRALFLRVFRGGLFELAPKAGRRRNHGC